MTRAGWLDPGAGAERAWRRPWTIAAVGLSVVCWYKPGWTSGLAPWPAEAGHHELLLLTRGVQLVLLLGTAYLATVVFPLGALGAGRWRKTVLLLAIAAMVTAVVIGLESWACTLAGLPPPSHSVVMAQAATFFAALSVAGQIIRGRGRLQTHELHELRLRAELTDAELRRTQAELRMLKREMNPHFLFNALQTVQALIVRDPAAATRAVVRLGDVLRQALQREESQEVALAEELELVRPFLEFEELRIGAPVTVEWRVTDEALGAQVPHLLLQPLLENAVKHGIAPRGGAGRIRVDAARDEGWLSIEVSDDGVGPRDLPSAERRGTGLGLANTRRRLRELYGDHQSFTLTGGPDGGAVARLRIPFRTGEIAGTS